MRISTAAHPTEYCRSAPPLNAFPRIPVTLGLPCSPENEEVPHGEKDQGQGGPETEVGERAFAERDRPHRPRLEAQRPGRAGSRDCARLVEDLEDASSRGILKKRLKYYAHSRLLIIDELGYLDVGSAGADLLFQLISTRYEQRSTIITTNVGISGRGRVFGDDVAASAIADRVCHHCHLVKITGRSYRLKDLPRDGPVKP